jgi:DNA polymerase III alpha subunit
LEFYFKDVTCPIVTGTAADRCKYFSATVYCEDQKAYQELCKIVSRNDMPVVDIYEEKQQLWGWADLDASLSLTSIWYLAESIAWSERSCWPRNQIWLNAY